MVETVLPKMGGRRFTLALIFAIAGTFGLFFDKVSGEEYYWLAGAVLVGNAASRTKWSESK